jgi:hypothetical protein
MLLDPLDARNLGVGSNTDLESFSNGEEHLTLELSHPELHTTVFGIDTLDEGNGFFLGGDNTPHGVIRSEVEVSDSFEHLLQVGTYLSHFFGLGQDLEEIVVTQEVEAAEESALLFEVILESLLHEFQVLVAVLEVLLAAFY